MVVIAGLAYLGFAKLGDQSQQKAGQQKSGQEELLRRCPDEKITDRMPTIGGQGNGGYYILDGKRYELDEFDTGWVQANCQVPEQEVW